MKRVLKSAGKVVIIDWCRDYVVCQIRDSLLKLFDPTHKQCYSQAEFHVPAIVSPQIIGIATKKSD